MTSTTPRTFPKFDLERLLRTVFEPQPGERIAILIDLDDPRRMRNFEFLEDERLEVQHHAHEVFYKGLMNGALASMGLSGGEMYAYRTTGGSNLDLPSEAYGARGEQVALEEAVYRKYDIILCISTYSATAPLTAHAKKFGFRGATLHGLNDIILATGLAVDYNEVSKDAEVIRKALTHADRFEIDFQIGKDVHTLTLLCDKQDAQKSHGLCKGKEPDVANLPAGEVYFVPRGAEGKFPMRYEDGTIGLMHVADGRIEKATLIRGNETTIIEHNELLTSDPMTGILGELGFGTQRLPVAGRDIQDEKILGTVHVATGRSDHLGGEITPDKFTDQKHATHEDILFAPHKTPEIKVLQVRMIRDATSTPVLENYEPAKYLQRVLESSRE